MAPQFAEGTITDMAWATPAAGQAPEYIATASGSTASVWKLAGSADKLQVWHFLGTHAPQGYKAYQLAPLPGHLKLQCMEALH